MAILGVRDATLDAVQEAWLRVIRRAGGFNGQSSVRTWRYRITVNECRRRVDVRPVAALDSLDLPGDARLDPARQAAAADEQERVKRLVQRLSPPLREVVLLCYVHGLTHAEAADVLGVAPGTVKSRSHASLERLRKQLGAASERNGSDHGTERDRST